VFTAAQARAEGWTARTVRRRIAGHRWVYVAGRALAEPSPYWTPFQLAVAARLTIGNVVISHRTAAALHGFPAEGTTGEALEECDVIVANRRPRGLRIRTHHLRLESADIQSGPCGLRLTRPARTALDCLASLDLGPALDLWAWLATRRILDHEGLRQAIDQRLNWHGTGQLRRIADLVAVVDVFFEQARLIVEVDGWEAHRSHDRFVRDRQRHNRLIVAGYRVLRFTWEDLTRRPHQVISEIRQALHLSGVVQPARRELDGGSAGGGRAGLLAR
jgi:very-short-patch-repair endonuclease